MLSIGKLENRPGRGAGNYYLESVAKGREDYYVGKGEAAGQWIGSGSKALGLTSEVDGQAFTRVLARRHPVTARWLGELTKEGKMPEQWRRTPGFDLTFSAPKSVSVLWGLAGEAVSLEVQAAHDHAVSAAMKFIEDKAAHSRRGHNGADRIGTTGLIAAAFRHRCSRAGDPALHTHCVVANVVKGADERWSSLDARLLYAWGKTAGYLYQAVLRKELVKRLGVEWGEVNRGTAEIVGIAQPVCRAFSKRREEIKRQLEALGETSAKAAQIATLDTRRAKEYGVDGAGLHDRWRAQGLQLGISADDLEATTGKHSFRDPSRKVLAAIAQKLSSPEGLTERASTFGQRETIQAWCDNLRDGADVSDILTNTSTFLADSAFVVPIGEGSGMRATDVIRREDGKVVSIGTDGARFTTPEMLATEKQLVASAASRAGAGVAVATSGSIARAIDQRSFLSDEQVAMIRSVAGGGDGVVVVVGRPGAGKTTALGACREAWEASGFRVVGCALAAETARTLQQGSGIESYTVRQLLTDIADAEYGGLAKGTVVVVDEAAMVGTRQLQPLLKAAEQHNAKVVLVGDDHQLPEIDAGGAFRGLLKRITSVQLIENRRQRAGWERYALERLRGGDAAAAIAQYKARDSVVVGPNADAVRRQMVEDWWKVRDQSTDAAKQPVMIASRHVDVDQLNDQARALRIASGELGQLKIEVAGREFAVGDRVVTLKNRQRLGVRNGTRGTVTAVDTVQKSITVHTDEGRDVKLPESYMARRVRHAYALTGHKAQGKTVSRAFVLADETTYREWAYTALSRGEEANRLYIVSRDNVDIDDLTHGPRKADVGTESAVHAMKRSAAQTMAVDYSRASDADVAAKTRGELAELQRLREVQRKLGSKKTPEAPQTRDDQGRHRSRRKDSRNQDRDAERDDE